MEHDSGPVRRAMNNPMTSRAKRENYLVFGRPLISEDEIAEVVDSLRLAWLGTGPKVARFEEDMAAYKKVKHAVALNSCTAALHLGCLAVGLQPGDEVIVPALTYCATVNAVIHAGATAILADIDPATQNICLEAVAAKITPRTRAILPVHFAGRPCEMDPLMALAERHGLMVIEDCAHAIETEYHGKKAGSFGICGALSFYVTKNLTTGEGGMILTDDDALAARVKILALQGMSKDAWRRFSDDGYQHYDVVEAGFKYNMMDLQAAIGLCQLQKVEKYWLRRQAIWEHYRENLGDLPLSLPAPVEANTRHGYHVFSVLLARESGLSRDQFIAGLHKQNIGVGVHYRALTEYSVYQDRYDWKPEDYPAAMTVGRSTVSLPLSAALQDEDVEDVVAAVRAQFGR